MYPLIGIISRKSTSITNKPINIIYKDIETSIIKSNGIPIGISNENIDKYLNLCQGFVFQGGDDIDDDNLKILKILREKNIPTLCICLGMQEMAVAFNGQLYDIDNHLNNQPHEINIKKDTLLYNIIKKDTLLYNIIKKDTILVNTRHKSAIKNTNLVISSLSHDNIIESIEDTNHKFYLGLQWHPENLYDIDINAKKIFDYFIKKCTH